TTPHVRTSTSSACAASRGMSQLPGNDLVVDFLRGGKKQTAKVRLIPREAAQADDVEVRTWGVVVRDLTQKLVREERLPAATGVWLENIRPAGPSGQAEPTLRRGDVLIAVEGKDVANVKQLQDLTKKMMVDAVN